MRALVILETKVEDLMRCLSRFVERKVSSTWAEGRKILAGRRGWIWPVMRWWRRVRAEGLLVLDGGWGACGLLG